MKQVDSKRLDWVFLPVLEQSKKEADIDIRNRTVVSMEDLFRLRNLAWSFRPRRESEEAW